jgi:hypothetical protein
MIHGIAIFGLNGGGKSTLTHALAKQIDCFEMDVEDYYFPEQRESRICALENNSIINIEFIDELPFSNPRTKNEVESAMKLVCPIIVIDGTLSVIQNLEKIMDFLWQLPLSPSPNRARAK